MARTTFIATDATGELCFDFSMDRAQASQPILLVNDDGSTAATPFQTADARHNRHEAAKLLAGYLKSEGDDCGTPAHVHAKA